ncbi:MAG TPA: phosphodiesterase, partial [Sulfitobacter sp.]|nr:phosphodiesterase [Sulfitobacter sp.]
MTRFVHLTDLHISHPDLADPHLQSDTPATLRRVVEVINAMDPQPDFVVASGDLTNQGDRESYALVHEITAPLKAPLVMALGNHDKRAGFNAVFAPG